MILAWSFANLFNPLKEPCCNDIHLETLISSWITVHSTNHSPFHPPTHPSIHLCTNSSIYQSTMYLPTYSPIRLLIHPSIHPSACPSIHLPINFFLESYHWLRIILRTGDMASEPNRVLLLGSLCSRWRSHIVNRLKHHHDNVRRWPML